MEITLQYFEGCPNWETTKRQLSRLIRDMGIDDAIMRRQLIDSPQAADEHMFRGSPTVLINGVDPFADPVAPIGLSCRIYRTENGLAGHPTPHQLKQAIETAQGSG